MGEYYAHKKGNGDLQTIKEHLEGTSQLAAAFASKFGAEEQGRLAGMLHDIGKYSSEFQNRLLKSGPKVDHSTAGAFECMKVNQPFAALCIAGHHTGLPDLGGPDDLAEGTFRAKINRACHNMIPSYSLWKSEITLPLAKLPVLSSNNSLNEIFYIRMLYSCLVDADYLNTEEYIKGARERGGDSVGLLSDKLLSHIKRRGWLDPNGLLNEKRSEILQGCLDKTDLKRGVFTLSVPTGGGKTVSSLAFALKHAEYNNIDRVIYVIPYTSIIEQTADVFRSILGKENVLEHHSGIEYDPDDRTAEADVKLSLAVENWDMPVIVTTAVQFFESLFANKSSKCRKLHNIVNSVIVFDEAQMLPIPYMRPCVYAMSQLLTHYNCSIVLCTATQPALDDSFSEFLEEYDPIELCPKHIITDPVFRRAEIQNAGDMSWYEVAEYMNRHYQILCIVNSRANARKVFEQLKGDGCYHLSTLMIPAHRKKKLKEIRKRLIEGKDCRVISTSLIEAGVDVDFPLVLREEAGIDSVIQAAGRCNREGKRPLQESIVKVFSPETRPPMLFKTNIDVGKMMMKKYRDITSPEAVHAYFNELFSIKGKSSFDKADIIIRSANGTFPFKTIGDKFHLIDNTTKTVYIPIEDGKELIEKKKNGAEGKGLYRELNQYSVNIYENHFKALLEAGDIESLDDGSWYLSNICLYDEDMGLSMEADYGKAEFI